MPIGVNSKRNEKTMANLQGRVAVVTGGGTGIGAGIVRRLAAEGCRLMVSASNSFGGAEELRDELRADGAEIEIMQADFRDPDTARGVVCGAIDLYGQLDILVNNAGWTLSEEFLEGATQNWLDIFNINLIAMITGSQEAARHMVERGIRPHHQHQFGSRLRASRPERRLRLHQGRHQRLHPSPGAGTGPARGHL